MSANTMMRRLHFLLVGVFTGQSYTDENASKISFTEVKHDFGKVKEDVELTFNFRFKNEGDDKLVIEKVQASCGCTGAAIGDKKEFNNGEEGEIKVTFSTTGRTGIQNKTVVVLSNDPENQTVILSFTCEIIK